MRNGRCLTAAFFILHHHSVFHIKIGETKMKKDCLFCDIVLGAIPSKKVYEDEYAYAFRDINPQAPVHVLIVPRKHIDSLADMNEENMEIISGCLKMIPEVVRICGLENGYRVITNVGEDGCQSVKHLHFHVLGGAKLSDKMG